MALKAYEESNIQAIADTIRANTGKDTKYKTSEMPAGVTEVYEAGQKAEYDKFWDSFQKDRSAYSYAFYGQGWNDETFKPKYDIVIKAGGNNANNTFAYARFTDLAKILDEQGVVIDYSKFNGANGYAPFMYCSKLTHIPRIAVNPDVKYANAYYACTSLHTIDAIVLSEEGTQTFTNTFYQCSALENIRIEGKIGKDFDIQYSPLTVESAKNIIYHLKDYIGTDEEMAYTLKFNNSVWDLLDAETDAPNGTTWREMVGDRGWNY